jgi:hypothetical protein
MTINPLTWHVLSFRFAPGLDELLAAYLFERGAAGSAQTEDQLVVYFPEQSDIGQIVTDFSRRLKADGVLLLSGLIEHEGESIRPALEHSGLQCLETRKEEEWLSLAATVGRAACLS